MINFNTLFKRTMVKRIGKLFLLMVFSFTITGCPFLTKFYQDSIEKNQNFASSSFLIFLTLNSQGKGTELVKYSQFEIRVNQEDKSKIALIKDKNQKVILTINYRNDGSGCILFNKESESKDELTNKFDCNESSENFSIALFSNTKSPKIQLKDQTTLPEFIEKETDEYVIVKQSISEEDKRRKIENFLLDLKSLKNQEGKSHLLNIEELKERKTSVGTIVPVSEINLVNLVLHNEFTVETLNTGNIIIRFPESLAPENFIVILQPNSEVIIINPSEIAANLGLLNNGQPAIMPLNEDFVPDKPERYNLINLQEKFEDPTQTVLMLTPTSKNGLLARWSGYPEFGVKEGEVWPDSCFQVVEVGQDGTDIGILALNKTSPIAGKPLTDVVCDRDTGITVPFATINAHVDGKKFANNEAIKIRVIQRNRGVKAEKPLTFAYTIKDDLPYYNENAKLPNQTSDKYVASYTRGNSQIFYQGAARIYYDKFNELLYIHNSLTTKTFDNLRQDVKIVYDLRNKMVKFSSPEMELNLNPQSSTKAILSVLQYTEFVLRAMKIEGVYNGSSPIEQLLRACVSSISLNPLKPIDSQVFLEEQSFDIAREYILYSEGIEGNSEALTQKKFDALKDSLSISGNDLHSTDLSSLSVVEMRDKIESDKATIYLQVFVGLKDDSSRMLSRQHGMIITFNDNEKFWSGMNMNITGTQNKAYAAPVVFIFSAVVSFVANVVIPQVINYVIEAVKNKIIQEVTKNIPVIGEITRAINEINSIQNTITNTINQVTNLVDNIKGFDLTTAINANLPNVDVQRALSNIKPPMIDIGGVDIKMPEVNVGFGYNIELPNLGLGCISLDNTQSCNEIPNPINSVLFDETSSPMGESASLSNEGTQVGKVTARLDLTDFSKKNEFYKKLCELDGIWKENKILVPDGFLRSKEIKVPLNEKLVRDKFIKYGITEPKEGKLDYLSPATYIDYRGDSDTEWNIPIADSLWMKRKGYLFTKGAIPENNFPSRFWYLDNLQVDSLCSEINPSNLTKFEIDYFEKGGTYFKIRDVIYGNIKRKNPNDLQSRGALFVPLNKVVIDFLNDFKSSISNSSKNFINKADLYITSTYRDPFHNAIVYETEVLNHPKPPNLYSPHQYGQGIDLSFRFNGKELDFCNTKNSGSLNDYTIELYKISKELAKTYNNSNIEFLYEIDHHHLQKANQTITGISLSCYMVSNDQIRIFKEKCSNATSKGIIFKKYKKASEDTIWISSDAYCEAIDGPLPTSETKTLTSSPNFKYVTRSLETTSLSSDATVQEEPYTNLIFRAREPYAENTSDFSISQGDESFKQLSSYTKSQYMDFNLPANTGKVPFTIQWGENTTYPHADGNFPCNVSYQTRTGGCNGWFNSNCWGDEFQNVSCSAYYQTSDSLGNKSDWIRIAASKDLEVDTGKVSKVTLRFDRNNSFSWNTSNYAPYQKWSPGDLTILEPKVFFGNYTPEKIPNEYRILVKSSTNKDELLSQFMKLKDSGLYFIDRVPKPYFYNGLVKGQSPPVYYIPHANKIYNENIEYQTIVDDEYLYFLAK